MRINKWETQFTAIMIALKVLYTPSCKIIHTDDHNKNAWLYSIFCGIMHEIVSATSIKSVSST